MKRNKRVSRQLAVRAEDFRALARLVRAVNDSTPDPAVFAKELATVFPWNRKRPQSRRVRVLVRGEDGSHPIEESELRAAIDILEVTTGEKRRAMVAAFEDIRARLRGLLCSVASLRDAPTGVVHVCEIRHPIGFTLSASGQEGLEGDWRDLIVYYAYHLCRTVGWDRLGVCPECGRLWVAQRRGRKRFCDTPCGNRSRQRDCELNRRFGKPKLSKKERLRTQQMEFDRRFGRAGRARVRIVCE